MMGCDIQVFLEVKVEGKWIFIGRLPGHRNYEEFGLMSGVRQGTDEGAFFPMPDDLPADCSDEIKEIWEDGDGYFHSLTLGTYKDICAFNRKYPVDINPRMAERWETIMRKTISSGVIEDARAIFAYDN
jgi:hypothetical protein